MIKPNELRIGNWLLNSGGVAFPVYTLKRGLEYKYTPIELTEEILKKSGFIERPGSGSGTRYYYPASFEGGNKKIFVRYEEYNNNWGENNEGWLVIGEWEGFNIVPIKYVHQLQNLFFALTGEKLTINL